MSFVPRFVSFASPYPGISSWWMRDYWAGIDVIIPWAIVISEQ